jgi:HicB_like antitoxin of bacterial toxin-antitoxin system
MAQEALELHVGGMLADGEELPAPSSLEVVMVDPEKADAVAFLVTLPEPADNPTEGLLRRSRRAHQEPLGVPSPRRRKGSCGGLT